MRTFHFALLLAAACTLSACNALSPFTPGASAPGQPPASATESGAAQEGLKTLALMVNAGNYAALGFSSPEEVRQATLGQPMTITRVQLDALLAFNGQGNAEALLVDARRTLFPVQVSERVASSIVVTNAGDGWRATDLGNAAVARAVTRYRSDPKDFIIQVPALRVYFVARRSDDTLMVTPVINVPDTDLRAGQAVPLAQALAMLQKVAQNYNGLPE